MRISNTRLFVAAVVLGGSLSAIASEPARESSEPASTAPIADTAKPAAAAASVAAAAKPADAPATAGTAETSRAAPVPAGYKVKVVDGETRYCRKSTPMGTRFPTEVCMTAAQYDDSIRNQNSLRQELTGRQKSYSINY